MSNDESNKRQGVKDQRFAPICAPDRCVYLHILNIQRCTRKNKRGDHAHTTLAGGEQWIKSRGGDGLRRRSAALGTFRLINDNSSVIDVRIYLDA